MKLIKSKKATKIIASSIRTALAMLFLFALLPLKASEKFNEKSGPIQKTISGIITDEMGIPLPGVNVLVVGTSMGTQTDFDGKFSILANTEDILRCSYIGFKTKDVVVRNQIELKISMEEDVNSLDEVVVLGYSSSIKRNLTSSVSAVTTEEIQEVPATSLSNAVAGRFAGVNISQAGGKPGRSSDIIIRGATSGQFAGNNQPLYVIDNIISTKELFDALDVSEVESVSILKDAASSGVYGSRAANGVVLVKTKSGRTGKPIINFTSSIGTTEPTNVPPMTSAYEQALIIGQVQDFNNVPMDDSNRFNQTELEYLKNLNIGSFLDQAEETPVLNRHAVTVNGGTDNVRYFMSGSYIKETGAFSNLSYQKTNFRAKVDVDITDDLNVSLNLNTNNDLREEFYWRWNGDDEDFGDFYRTGNRTGRWGPAVHNGEYVANFNGWNPVHLAQEGAGSKDRSARNIGAIVDVNYKFPFVEGLTAGLTYNKLNIRNDQTLLRNIVEDVTFGVDPNNRFVLTDEILGTRLRSDDGANSNSLRESTAETNSYQLNARLGYENTFGDHSLNALFNYEQYERDDKSFYALRRGLLTPLVSQLFATNPAVENQFADGNAGETGRQSYIGTLGYNFQNKYFLNSTFRYDGSVQFAEDERWGFFPSVSAAWIVSEEGFFKNNFSFFDFFKLRYSIGNTGNDDVTGQGATIFPYIQNYNVGGTGPIFGTNNAISSATSIGAEPDLFITWEKQTSYNFGIDFQVLDDKLSTTIDFFKNKKTDLYGSRQVFIPSSSGLILGPVNYGAIDIKGVEGLVTYKDNLTNDFSYEVGFNIGYSKAEYVTLDEPQTRRPFELLSGQETSRIMGLKAEGIIRTEEQLNNLIASGYKVYGQDPQIGALYFRDLRGPAAVDPEGNTPDGVIDDNDRDYIGARSNPSVNYGIRLNLRYKRFSLLAFGQGFAGHERYQPSNNRFQFASIGQSSHTQWLNAWTPDNPNNSFPRFGSPFGDTNSSFWLEDADFLRLKNLNFGYDIPVSLVNKVGAERINIFANGTNLFMIYSKIKAFDPETSGRGIPVNRSYSLGVNVTF
ncbi:TonB-dependent receptor [Arenibacter sp. 6A1]|uniref:SusC/RagA family TonB-linked outer membrane protein n=1 Tax=Arenibacter sp. 6A1 TaxID=2720391 RepID=UPI001445003D|nr:TonB-dependent receptor [Arenibacter sp. 6A1]NKI27475.1 TonB-dependent receptor [Arenibacter sp. 6A1]